MSATSLIPAKHADIYWNDDADHSFRAAGAEVLVVDRSPGQPQRSRENNPVQFASSHGAMMAGWMEDGHPLHNPAGVFGLYWVARGATPVSVHAALREFAKIAECQWARDMLAVFDWQQEQTSQA